MTALERARLLADVLLAAPAVDGYKTISTWINGKDVLYVTFKTPTNGTTETIRIELSEGDFWVV